MFDMFDNFCVEIIMVMFKCSMGKSVGIVFSVFGVDVMFVVFVVYIWCRGDYQVIVDQYFKGDVKFDVLLIGGSCDFIFSIVFGSCCKDNIDWISEFQKMGYQFVFICIELNVVIGNKLFGLFNIDNIFSYFDCVQFKGVEIIGDFKDMLYLWDSIQKVVQILEKNFNGFFLMVEVGMVDKYEYLFDWNCVVWDVLEFDKVVVWVKDYVKSYFDMLILVIVDYVYFMSVYGGYDVIKGFGKCEVVGVYEKVGFFIYGDKCDVNGFLLFEIVCIYVVGFVVMFDYCEIYLGCWVFLDFIVSNGKMGVEVVYVFNFKICDEGVVQCIGNFDFGSSQGVYMVDFFFLFVFGVGVENFSGVMDQIEIFFGMVCVLGFDVIKNK